MNNQNINENIVFNVEDNTIFGNENDEVDDDFVTNDMHVMNDNMTQNLHDSPSYFFQDDISISNLNKNKDHGPILKCRRYNQMKDITEAILEKSSKVPMNIQEMIGGTLVALNNILDHQEIPFESSSSQQTIESNISKLWSEHISRFVTVKDDINVNSNKRLTLNAVPNKYFKSKRIVNRPKAMYERVTYSHSKGPNRSICNKTLDGKIKQKSCSFCKYPGHTISTCPAKQSYGYIISNVTLFRNEILTSKPLGSMINQNVITSNVSSLSGKEM